MKRCSENMLQIFRGTPMPKCDFNKVAKQLNKFDYHLIRYCKLESQKTRNERKKKRKKENDANEIKMKMKSSDLLK